MVMVEEQVQITEVRLEEQGVSLEEVGETEQPAELEPVTVMAVAAVE
jgi:hypothetical protein